MTTVHVLEAGARRECGARLRRENPTPARGRDANQVTSIAAPSTRAWLASRAGASAQERAELRQQTRDAALHEARASEGSVRNRTGVRRSLERALLDVLHGRSGACDSGDRLRVENALPR